MAEEAKHNLAQLEVLVSARYAKAPMPEYTSAWAPAKACCAQPKKRCDPEDPAFRATPWKELGFKPGPPHRFQYRYVREDQRVELLAQGDADCDGVYSLYRVLGTPRENGSYGFSELIISDELE